MNSQFYQFTDAIVVSVTMASDLQHLHASLQLADAIIVSANIGSDLRNLISWINCKIVASQAPCEMDVTPRKRTQIVTLHKHTATTYWETAAFVGESLATVSRVIKLKEDAASVSPERKGKCHCKKKTAARDVDYLLRQRKKDPRKMSDA